MDSFRFDEKNLSQIPALQVLINPGYQYLTPTEALTARGGKAGGTVGASLPDPGRMEFTGS